MVLNLSAVALMAIAWAIRPGDAATGGVLLIEMLAVGLLCYGSLQGGVLVTRNQISIDHRYAGAGKWSEISVPAEPGKPVDIASSDELKRDQMKLIRIADRRIVLARTENGYVAFDDRCSHRGGSLAGGSLICGAVQCPWHGSQFDVRSGAVKAGPAKEAITVYAVEEKGGRVRLLI
jgi:nitrite reductase/ring-hydroxylating ferredoxin subunit